MLIIYSRDTCAPCRTLKYWLQRKGISFQEVPIDQSDYRIAPTVEVKGEVIAGLNFKRLNEILDLA